MCKEIRKRLLGKMRIKIDREMSKEITEKLDLMKSLFVQEVAGKELKVAHERSAELKSVLTDIKGRLGVCEILFHGN